MEAVQEFLNIFLGLVLEAAAVALAGVAIVAINRWANKIKAQLTEEERRIVNRIVDMAVTAAEQSKIAGFIDDKKDAALKSAERELTKLGIEIDLVHLSDLIEAQVYDSFHWNKSAAE